MENCLWSSSPTSFLFLIFLLVPGLAAIFARPGIFHAISAHTISFPQLHQTMDSSYNTRAYNLAPPTSPDYGFFLQYPRIRSRSLFPRLHEAGDFAQSTTCGFLFRRNHLRGLRATCLNYRRELCRFRPIGDLFLPCYNGFVVSRRLLILSCL